MRGCITHDITSDIKHACVDVIIKLSPSAWVDQRRRLYIVNTAS